MSGNASDVRRLNRGGGVSPGGLKIRLVSTAAGRTARALLEEGLLDIVLTGYPPVIRLTVLPTSAAALT